MGVTMEIHTMSFRKTVSFISAACLICLTVAYAEFSIPSGEIDNNEIFFGSPTSFSNPAEVDVEAVIKATPEHKEIKKKKIDRGTGRYWILHSNATNRAHRAIRDYAENSGYDLVANIDYLGSLTVPIAADDVTKAIKKLASDD